MIDFNKIKDKMIFKYQLYDAWNLPLEHFVVYDLENKGLIFYSEECEESETSIELSLDDLNKIKELLNNNQLVKIDDLPIPPIFDGFINVFEIYSTNKTYKIECFNLDYYLEEKTDNKDINILLDLVEKINNIVNNNYINISLS